MIDKSLIAFYRNSNIENNTDFGEKMGNVGLGLLRIGFGKTMTVGKISDDADKSIFTEKIYSISTKVASVALLVLALPVTLLFASIGYLGITWSKSHRQLFNLYNEDREKLTANSKISHETKPVLAAIHNAQSFTNQLSNRTHQQSTITVSHPNTPSDKAAAIIQKHFRGYLARKPHLPSHLYPYYQFQCDKIKGPEHHSIPQAEGGKTTVYLPKEMPGIVIKNSGRKNAIKRFHQMQEVRAILDSENSSHLIIPKANLCQNFLVEERLPINADSYHNMALYLSQPELFDEAVRELTRLFSSVYLGDLVDRQCLPISHIAGVGDFVRYDNLPMYIVEENGKRIGKIGLIDLEQLQKGRKPQGHETLARIFPLHVDIIKNEASKRKMDVHEVSIYFAAQKGRKYLQFGFTDHFKWLQQAGISTEILSQPFQIKPQRVEELIHLVEKELLKLNQGINDLFIRKRCMAKPEKDFFTESPKKIAREIAKSITPLIIHNIKTQIEKHQNEKLSELSCQDMTESQWVSLRSPYIKRTSLYKDVDRLILENPKINFENKFMSQHGDIAEQVSYVIMEELVKGGEIFYFDPAYYTGDHELCWIRY